MEQLSKKEVLESFIDEAREDLGIYSDETIYKAMDIYALRILLHIPRLMFLPTLFILFYLF